MPIEVEELEPPAFRQRRAAPRAGGRRATNGGDSGAFWTGLGFAAPNANIAAMATSVRDEQVDGFYDRQTKKLVLRKGVASIESSRSALMHEIEHALQDQNFGLAQLGAAPDEDAELAIRSLYEGDATLASNAFHVDAAKPPSREWLVRVLRDVRSTPFDAIAEQGGGRSKELLAAPPLMRARLMSPYIDGMAFVADIYRAGGFALVNDVFAHPPSSTEHILHPEKYVAGELPIPVDAPTAPPGHRLATNGRMGELQLGIFLAQCMGVAEAKQIATGWGGDAYAIVVDAMQRQGLLIATAWDDEAAAARFMSALDARRTCVAKQGAEGAAIAESLAVRRDKTRVAYVHGLDASARESTLIHLLSLPGATPAPTPPIGAVTIPLSALPEDFLAKGAVDDRGRFASAQLGVSFILPRGKPLEPFRGDELHFVTDPPSDVERTFRFVLSAPSSELEARLVESIARGLNARHANLQLKDDGVREVTYSFARARVHRWSLANQVFLMTVVAPACGGAGTLMFTAVWRESGAVVSIERWLESVELQAKDVPVCVYLAEPRRR